MAAIRACTATLKSACPFASFFMQICIRYGDETSNSSFGNVWIEAMSVHQNSAVLRRSSASNQSPALVNVSREHQSKSESKVFWNTPWSLWVGSRRSSGDEPGLYPTPSVTVALMSSLSAARKRMDGVSPPHRYELLG